MCLNSATACLELSLKLLGIGEGDEVITSAYTYTASASVIAHVGAKIVLVDTVANSYFMDYEKLGEAITEKTKAIIPVDIAGVPCDYDKLFAIVESKKKKFKPNNAMQQAFKRIVIIGDAAHSFGSTYKNKRMGSVADFTCFSFHAVKNLTTAEGGAVTWRDINGVDNEKIYREYMLWSLHGQNKDALSKAQLGGWEYDIGRLGYKCNMTDIMASIGLAQLDRYGGIMNRRAQIIKCYTEELNNSVDILQHFTNDYCSCGHLYLTRIVGDENKRNQIIIKLGQAGIATNVHYKPLPMHTAYKNIGFDITDFPNSYNQYKNEITLPLHTLLTDGEVEYIIENYKRVI